MKIKEKDTNNYAIMHYMNGEKIRINILDATLKQYPPFVYPQRSLCEFSWEILL